MLQQMRQFSKSWVSSLFLGALSLSFVAWGIGDIFHGSSSTAVATVGRTSIEREEFKRDYDNYVHRLGEQRGKEITADEARKNGLGPAFLQQEIARTALDNVVSDLGLTVSDDTVSTLIRSLPQFSELTGTFDRKAFLQAISKMNYSEKGFIELVRRELARDQLVHAAESGFAIPAGYARALFAYSTERRAVDYVTLNDNALSPIAPPSDAVLTAYVKSHADRFSTPEYRDVTYADVGPDDVSKTITVTDAQIAAAYDAQKDKYVIPEKRELERINYQTLAEAEAASAKIKAGQTFEQAAFAHGDKPTDINLGTVTAADLVDPEQSKAAFAAPEGSVTAPVKGSFGYAIFHVVKIVPGKTTTLDQAKEELRKQVLQELAQSKLADIANAYTDAVSGGAIVVEAAKKVGIRSNHFVAMDREGLAPDGSKTAAPDDADFRAQVFAAEVGEDGDLVPTKSGHYYVVMVNGVVPPKLKPVDAVRAPATAAWTQEQRSLLLRKKAEELASEANKGRSLDDIAQSIGTKVQSSQALTRQSSDATFSPDLVSAIFSVPPRGAVFGPQGSGGYIIARVTGITHPVPPIGDPMFMRGVRQISGGVGSDITESLALAARDKQGVKTNAKILSDVTGEGS
ncbi:MAG: SurA N-terminal domain-containing protein [Rhizomicrobium sp.]